ncbi:MULTISPECIES: hypothetical protein [Luteimonas]|uniref:hypothetical protein n=1 Tax=Luteimonas TaxID=83614 RepID=UPI000C7D6C76|nr:MULTISPECIES: hypothetical protein [Luteimonas]
MSDRTRRPAVPRPWRGRLPAATVAGVATVAQAVWASPVARSAAEWGATPLVYLSLLCLVALVSTRALLALLPRRLGPAAQAYAIVLWMLGYWLLLAYVDFSVRVAAWSTYDTSSILLHVLRASALPIAVCAGALLLVLPRVLERGGR